MSISDPRENFDPVELLILGDIDVMDRVRGCMVCGEHAPKCERCGRPADVYGSDGGIGEYLCFVHVDEANRGIV